MGPDAAATLAGVAWRAPVNQGLRRAALPLALLLLAASWLWLQWPQVALLPGDEPLYFLDAQRLLDGGALYRDIFLAHPPARVWQAALVLAIGAPAGWAKFWSPLATIATAGVLVEIGRRHAPFAGVIGALLFLFAKVVLLHGALFVGVEQAMFLAVIATALVLSKRWLLAGMVLGFATQWALHVGILALPLLVLAHRDGVLRRFAGGLALGLVPLALELAWYGQPMVEQVFGYHLRKVTDMAAQKVPDRVWPFLEAHGGLLIIAGLGVARVSGPFRRLGFIGFSALGVLLLWPRLQPYYFLLPIPMLAAVAAAFLLQLYRQPRPTRARIRDSVVLFVAVVALLVDILPARHEERSLDRRERMLTAQTEMAALAAQVQTLAHGQPLWGDGALVPLLSLRTRLPVALGDTDLNSQRFLSGLTQPAPHLSQVLAQKPLIVLVPRHGIDLVPEFHDRLLRDCDVVGEFDAKAANFAGLLLRPR